MLKTKEIYSYNQAENTITTFKAVTIFGFVIHKKMIQKSNVTVVSKETYETEFDLSEPNWSKKGVVKKVN